MFPQVPQFAMSLARLAQVFVAAHTENPVAHAHTFAPHTQVAAQLPQFWTPPQSSLKLLQLKLRDAQVCVGAHAAAVCQVRLPTLS